MHATSETRPDRLGGSHSDLRASERRVLVTVRGIVQGVGFRPFIYVLAHRFGISGMVRNDAKGVYIEAQAEPDAIDAFLHMIADDPPRLAHIESISWQPLPIQSEEEGFRIEESREDGQRVALISPDVATCEACVQELLDPRDRRYRYPFINCTDCGPRFTITRAVPYDRRQTTMATFDLCATCAAEYSDPANRRFHAQPNACPVCGPAVRLLDRCGDDLCINGQDPIARTASLLRNGSIVAIKGLGGYHLSCDPFDHRAVRVLRDRKMRQDKPFAVMARDMDQVHALGYVSAEEESLLRSFARPIVLLKLRSDSGLGPDVAPRQRNLGVMLAYTPLHHLLLNDAEIPLVMTSGNRSGEPIAYRDELVFEQLGHIADFFLVHDRPIHIRCDDSVVRVSGKSVYPLRRSRGYAPAPVKLTHRVGQHMLGCGGELKNTFCLARDHHAFVSHHIGDLANYETLRSFREEVDHFCSLFDVHPTLVSHDLHPEYLSTKFAKELEEAGMATVGIQHHHAHIASCLVDNGRPIDERVIGVAFDGTGHGTDGALWGGEFFVGGIEDGFARGAHLQHLALPGGEAAIRQPWRIAIAALLAVWTEEEVVKLPLQVVRDAGDRNIRLIGQMIRSETNTPLSSGAGRLFDSIAALLSIPSARHITYEGQAAIELELLASGVANSGYPFGLRETGDSWVFETREMVVAIVDDLVAGISAKEIAGRFHRTVADIVLALGLHLGTLDGPVLVCPWHGCRYDVRTGKRLDADGKLGILPVAVKDGIVKVAMGLEEVAIP